MIGCLMTDDIGRNAGEREPESGMRALLEGESAARSDVLGTRGSMWLGCERRAGFCIRTSGVEHRCAW